MEALVRWVALGAYTALITRLSLAPSSSLKLFSRYFKFPNADKVAHFAMYGVLAALLVWAFRVRVTRFRAALWVAGVCIAYGLLMEVLQIIILPGDRHFSLLDFAANTAGAVASVFLLSICAQAQEVKKRRRGEGKSLSALDSAPGQ